MQTETTYDQTKIGRLVATVGDHRIRNMRVEGEWVVWDTHLSEQTMSKFVLRAKREGYRSVFSRGGRFGCHVDYLEA